MTALTSRERLQPSLLDRLTDQEPGNPHDSPDTRMLSLTRLKSSVLRDLAWLLNATSLLDTATKRQTPADHSVINFGLPPLAGHSLYSVEVPVLEKLIHQAIITYEPRILAATLRVRAETSSDQITFNVLGFEIAGDLWAQPMVLPLLLRTELDLESGHMQVIPAGNRTRA
ncbi:type VI secretion system baseplate subunit TssE [Pseudomonas huanghezhanensis]|uniref:type VI secretion system baseplate subunit TssE n=1 Tax=Pseudomonas huanghezhanensis TaxID=3002903 RepID=UPI002285FA69|nr:type VI secretion system baseplate subunit TssE [Pseudomonas sp. BSw22131]